MKKEPAAYPTSQGPYEKFRQLAASIVKVPRSKIKEDQASIQKKPAKIADKLAK
jgi:hypothetical protein